MSGIVTPDYARRMARYNAWQSHQIGQALQDISDAALVQDREAFWGSLLGTLNHLCWGDLMWMARFDGGPVPDVAQGASGEMFVDRTAWAAARAGLDRRITVWAGGLSQAGLDAELSWFSGTVQKTFAMPLSQLVVHFFNHQTHHRGQIHVMLSQAGATPPVTDLFLMPEHGPWD